MQPSHIQNPGLFRIQGIVKMLSNIKDDHTYSEPWDRAVYSSIFKDI